MECLVGGSRSRVPPRRRYADAPAATLLPISACANSRTVAVPPLCSVLRYAHFLPRRGSRAAMVHRVHVESKRAVRGRIQAPTAPIPLRMAQTTSQSVSRPHHQACRHARSVNGGAVLHSATALRVTAAVRASQAKASGRGTSRAAPRGGFALSPPARIEQATGPPFRFRKILAIRLGFPPAQYNHAASSPGLHCRDVL